MAQIARTETDKFVGTSKDATGNGAELGKRTADKIEDAGAASSSPVKLSTMVRYVGNRTDHAAGAL